MKHPVHMAPQARKLIGQVTIPIGQLLLEDASIGADRLIVAGLGPRLAVLSACNQTSTSTACGAQRCCGRAQVAFGMQDDVQRINMKAPRVNLPANPELTWQVKVGWFPLEMDDGKNNGEIKVGLQVVNAVGSVLRVFLLG
eukprot:968649-Amphidinium_carterae.1